MIYTVHFPVRNKVIVLDEFPVRLENKCLLIESGDGLMKSVGVSFDGLSADQAPKIIDENKQNAGEKNETPAFTISFSRNSQISEAIAILRAWQALLAPSSMIEIDFSNPQENFAAEKDENIEISNFNSKKMEIVSGFRDFGIYGRAFLASPECMDITEPTAFYIEAQVAQHEGRIVHAYNSYYLVIETLFADGKFEEKQVVDKLLRNVKFMKFFVEGIKTSGASISKKERPAPFGLKNLNDHQMTLTEIVKLRGRLRHHSLKNKKRWDPNYQKQFTDEVYVLASICQEALFEKSTREIFDTNRADVYVKLAHEKGMKMTCVVEVTVLENGLPRVTEIYNLTYPQKTATSELALEVLKESIDLIQKNSPDSEVLSIRSYNKHTGVEIFRYGLSGAVDTISKVPGA